MALVVAKQLRARDPGSRQTNQFLDWETMAAVTIVGLGESDATHDIANEKVLKSQIEMVGQVIFCFCALFHSGGRDQDCHLSTVCPLFS